MPSVPTFTDFHINRTFENGSGPVESVFLIKTRLPASRNEVLIQDLGRDYYADKKQLLSGYYWMVRSIMQNHGILDAIVSRPDGRNFYLRIVRQIY